MSSTSKSSYLTTFSFIIAFLFLSSTTPPYSAARILVDVAEPPQRAAHHPTQPSITFTMQDIVPNTNTIINPQQQQQQPLLPFSKPLRNFPYTYGTIPSPYQTTPNHQKPPTQTFQVPKFGIAFAETSKTLQEELEFGSVTNIDEEVYDGSSVFGAATPVVGKARGVYVAMSSSENGNDNSHMMAMTVSFSTENGDDNETNDDEVDSLNFFGVHKRDALECHVAVIGGTGKFKDANGFAAIKLVSRNKESDNEQSNEDQSNLMLTYNVYLS